MREEIREKQESSQHRDLLRVTAIAYRILSNLPDEDGPAALPVSLFYMKLR